MFPIMAAAQDNPPPIPHQTEGRETCSACHGQTGIFPAPPNHASFANTLCLKCHEVATPPPVPHETADKADCNLCHAQDSILPAPANHVNFVDRCLDCHPTTDVTTPPIPHETKGHEDCVACHGADGFIPEPPSHEGYQETYCLLCHEVNVGAGSQAGGAAPVAITSDDCMKCHDQPGLTMTLDDGEVLSLYVDQNVWMGSVHGDKLNCTDCHTNITTFPHETWDIPSKRDYSISQYDLCRRCHFDNYTKTLDSIHYKMFSEGDQNAPLCTDCHGAHDIIALPEDRRAISQTCARCHPAVYDQYINSVHGQALLSEDNYDVPVCTDCHTAHTIQNPTTASFRLESVQLCANCHSNAELMKKYGLSPYVVTSYLEDFHGRTVALITKENKDIWVQEAVCTDCHGIHDIIAVDSPDSPVIKANLEATCAKCHPGISTQFSGAWLGHYEPSLHKFPMIFLVQWFYKIMIPFVLVGLSLHVLLDLWRRITNR
jgi:predicted CXXCH cytochrome family protein